jgi:predicted nucleic acid-binding protein
MPSEPVLVDTGPLVALFDPSDAAHGGCVATMESLGRRELVTSLAVVTEAMWLLAPLPRAQTALASFLEAEALRIAAFGARDVARAVGWMSRYANVPMDFADATLVTLAEGLQTRSVFTLDLRDFSIYRTGRRAFRVLTSARE